MRKAVYKSILLAPALLAGAMLCHASRAAEQDIHALRSAYLYYFSNFIRWPKNSVFQDKTLNLCAFTDDAEDRYQLFTIEDQTIGDLKLKITIVDMDRSNHPLTIDFDSLQRCHLIYLSEEYNGKIPSERRVRLSDTIFVTEDDANDEVKTENIGDIHLFTRDNKLTFYINADSLQSRDFEASSKLLRLSKQVPDHE
jgi:hypothetical protein